VSWGDRFEILYDANGKVVNQTWSFDDSLRQVSYGALTEIYTASDLDLDLLPQDPPKVKNARIDQQTRFNEGYAEILKRLQANGGKNPCADFFGGIKNLAKALKDTHYSFGTVQNGAEAETRGKNITIHPNGIFMTENEYEKFEVDVDFRRNQGDYIALSNIEVAAFVLAHEWGHRTGKLPSDDIDDSNFASVVNNGKIRDACFADKPRAIGPAVPK
jgi:hypothetical protein